MRTIINGLRAIIFNLVFILFAVVSFLFLAVIAQGKTDSLLRKGLGLWIKGTVGLARVIMGIKVEYRGLDILPKKGAIVMVAKHQSNIDPMLAYIVREDVSAFAKKELFATPLVGAILRGMGIIRVDRGAGTAHKSIDVVREQVLAKQRPLLVYPEGTRVPIGERRKLKPGAFFVQNSHDLPVYTVATNSGCFWVKGFWHKPGTIIFEVDGPLKGSLDKAEFMDQVHEKVVVRSDQLIRETGALIPPLDEQPMRGKSKH